MNEYLADYKIGGPFVILMSAGVAPIKNSLAKGLDSYYDEKVERSTGIGHTLVGEPYTNLRLGCKRTTSNRRPVGGDMTSTLAQPYRCSVFKAPSSSFIEAKFFHPWR